MDEYNFKSYDEKIITSGFGHPKYKKLYFKKTLYKNKRLIIHHLSIKHFKIKKYSY